MKWRHRHKYPPYALHRRANALVLGTRARACRRHAAPRVAVRSNATAARWIKQRHTRVAGGRQNRWKRAAASKTPAIRHHVAVEPCCDRRRQVAWQCKTKKYSMYSIAQANKDKTKQRKKKKRKKKVREGDRMYYYERVLLIIYLKRNEVNEGKGTESNQPT